MYLEEDNKRSYPDCLLMIYQQMTACDYNKLDGSMLVLVLQTGVWCSDVSIESHLDGGKHTLRQTS